MEKQNVVRNPNTKSMNFPVIQTTTCIIYAIYGMSDIPTYLFIPMNRRIFTHFSLGI